MLLTPREYRNILDILRPIEPELAKRFQQHYEDGGYLRPDREEFIQKAKDQYCDSSCDIEVYDTASVSEGDGGTWVSAQLWIPDEDSEEDDDDAD